MVAGDDWSNENEEDVKTEQNEPLTRTVVRTVLSSWWLVTTGGESRAAVCQEGRSRATRGGATSWRDT